MLIFNKKKKKLNNIYNKIVEESKVSYYLFNSELSDTDHFREVFQLNLILILWYMKTKNFSEKYLEYLIKIFIKDLEGMVIELGGSETSLRKSSVIVSKLYPNEIINAIIEPPEHPTKVSTLSNKLLSPKYFKNPR